MPGIGINSFEHGRMEARRLKAWMHHYEKKGCSKWKAGDVARKKWRHSNTWPPQE